MARKRPDTVEYIKIPTQKEVYIIIAKELLVGVVLFTSIAACFSLT